MYDYMSNPPFLGLDFLLCQNQHDPFVSVGRHTEQLTAACVIFVPCSPTWLNSAEEACQSKAPVWSQQPRPLTNSWLPAGSKPPLNVSLFLLTARLIHTRSAGSCAPLTRSTHIFLSEHEAMQSGLFQQHRL